MSYRSGERVLVAVKGSPEAVLPHAEYWQRGAERLPLDRALRAELLAKAREFGRRGLRVLAVAEREASASEVLGLVAPAGADLPRLHRLQRSGAADVRASRRGSARGRRRSRDADGRPPEHGRSRGA